FERPRVARDGLAGVRRVRDPAHHASAARRRGRAGAQRREDGGPYARPGTDVEGRGHPSDRAESGAGAAGGGVAVTERPTEIGDALAAVEPDDLDAVDVVAGNGLQHDLAAAAVLDDVRADRGDDERHF